MTKEYEEQIESYINECFKNGTTPIIESDAELYAHFFEKHQREFNYADSWFYLTQAVNGVGKHTYPLGFKYIIDNCLFTIGIFISPYTKKTHFHIVNPLGKSIKQHIDKLASLLFNISNTFVYLKKLEGSLISELINLGNYKIIEKVDDKIPSYAWHKDAPLEDDTFPELVLDIDLTLSMLNERGENQVKDKINRFKNRNKDSIIEWKDVEKNNKEDAKQVINNFFKYKQEDDIDISTPDDYINMIETVPKGKINQHYLQKIIYINNEPLALVCTEKLNNSNCHGLYSNVSLYHKAKWLSEYVIIEILKILKNLGVKYLNLGGSETEGLHNFKKKFRPIQERYSYWLVYDKY